MGNETMKLAKIFKQIDKSINIVLKTHNKLNNIISNNIENAINSKKRGVYKLTCNNSNRFYICRTKRDFKTRFNDRTDFPTSTGRSTVSLSTS